MTWDAYVYDLPLTRPYTWAKGAATRRQGILVACRQGETTGWGEVAFPPHEQQDLHALATQLLLHADEWSPTEHDHLAPRIRSGIAGAWFDLQARRERDPLARMLAERIGHDAVATHVEANGLVEAGDAQAMVERATSLAKQGYRTLKVKSDGKPAHDLATVAAIRDAVGAGVKLRLDANEAWSPEHAKQHLVELARFELDYVEQPVPANRPKDLLHLLQSSPVPIALDESTTSWNAVHPFLQGGASPICIVKPQRLGGPDRTADFLQQAHDHKVRVTVTNSLETSVGRSHALHLAALLDDPQPACGLATANYLAKDVAATPADAPRIPVPRRAGLGIDVDAGGLRHVVP